MYVCMYVCMYVRIVETAQLRMDATHVQSERLK
jgi:hypothetical protein